MSCSLGSLAAFAILIWGAVAHPNARTCESIFAKDELIFKVRRNLGRTNARDLNIQYNGTYYVLGQEGLPHEEVASSMIATRILKPGEDFLFLGLSGRIQTPGIDGTIFRDNVLKPVARVSLKSIQSFKNPDQLVTKLVSITSRATARANKFGLFKHVYQALFPPFAPSEMKNWLHRPGTAFYERVSLMAAMGLQQTRAPLKIVFLMENMRSTDFPQLQQIFLYTLEQYARTSIPDSIVLLYLDRAVELNRGEDY